MSPFSAPLIQTLLSSLQQYLPQLHGKRIWLACSGGRDSLSLAMVCRKLFNDGQLPFLPQLLHVNHGMQVANTAWAEQVVKWADENGMSCQVLQIEQDIKTEQSARQARYDAMMCVMNADDVLMLGHHMDDQVETVLMRLFNGAGVNGLSGMAAFSSKTATRKSEDDFSSATNNNTNLSKTIYLWRPWLKVSRAEITQYAKASNLPYIDDPTNVAHSKSVNYQIESVNTAGTTPSINDRAWLRGALMPTITKRYPQALEAISRSSQHMANATDIINKQVESELNYLIVNLAGLSRIKDMHSVLNIKALLNLSQAMQSALIHKWLQPNKAELPPSTQLVHDVLQLCQRLDSNHKTRLYWNSGLHQYEIRRYQNFLYRLRVEWLDWLSEAPQTTTIQSITFENASKLSLKKTADFNWQISSLTSVFQVLGQRNWSIDSDQIECVSNIFLKFEPLSRDVKLVLAGRQGSKSGKKLLQAINLPVFMRESVMLCSLVKKSAGMSGIILNTPLFIVSVHGIYSVESDVSDKIIDLVNHHQLVTEVVYSRTDRQ